MMRDQEFIDQAPPNCFSGRSKSWRRLSKVKMIFGRAIHGPKDPSYIRHREQLVALHRIGSIFLGSRYE